MRHPTDGTLRRLVDEPQAVPDADREHVAACPACLATLAAPNCDIGLVGYEMTLLVDRVGQLLTPELRAELQGSALR